MGSFKSERIGIQPCPFVSVSSMAALELQIQGWIAAAEILGPQFSSVQSLSRVRLFATPWTIACQTSLSIANSQSLLKLMSIESVMPSNHLILCRPLLFLLSIFPSIRVFSSESVLHIRWRLEFQLQHQSLQWTPRTDLLKGGLVGSLRAWTTPTVPS